MTEHLRQVVAEWAVPRWAQVSETDEDAVIHTRSLASVTGLDGELMTAELVQRDELHLTPGVVVSVTRDKPWVRLGGVRLAIGQALYLACQLTSSNGWIEQDATMPEQLPSMPALSASPVPLVDGPLLTRIS